MAISDRQLPEVLFYVWAFDPQATHYVPLAVFNTEVEALGYVADVKDWIGEHKTGHLVVEKPLRLTWTQFCTMAKERELKGGAG